MKGILLWGFAALLLIVLLFGGTAGAQDVQPVGVIDHKMLTGSLTADELAQAAGMPLVMTDRSVGYILFHDYIKDCMRFAPVLAWRCEKKYNSPVPGRLNITNWRYYTADEPKLAAPYLADAEIGGWFTSYVADTRPGLDRVLAPLAADPPDKWLCFTTSLPRGVDLARKLQPYNDDLRARWQSIGCDVLVDMADIESHDPDGNLCAVDGVPVMCPQYTTEVYGGHPHAVGLRRMAEGLIRGMLAGDAEPVTPEPEPTATVAPTASPTPQPTATVRPPDVCPLPGFALGLQPLDLGDATWPEPPNERYGVIGMGPSVMGDIWQPMMAYVWRGLAADPNAVLVHGAGAGWTFEHQAMGPASMPEYWQALDDSIAARGLTDNQVWGIVAMHAYIGGGPYADDFDRWLVLMRAKFPNLKVVAVSPVQRVASRLEDGWIRAPIEEPEAHSYQADVAEVLRRHADETDPRIVPGYNPWKPDGEQWPQSWYRYDCAHLIRPRSASDPGGSMTAAREMGAWLAAHLVGPMGDPIDSGSAAAEELSAEGKCRE